MRKVNYLNNKDILKEIHKSKLTYCSFVKPEVTSYDMILLDVNAITKKTIAEARKMRAERLAKATIEKFALEGVKKKMDEVLTPTKDIPITDIVFRVMTFEHIPIDDVKQAKADQKAIDEAEDEAITTEYDDDPSKAKGVTKYVKVNFPPFFHYCVNEDSEPYITGKSHWKGTIEKGDAQDAM